MNDNQNAHVALSPDGDEGTIVLRGCWLVSEIINTDDDGNTVIKLVGFNNDADVAHVVERVESVGEEAYVSKDVVRTIIAGGTSSSPGAEEE